MRISYCSSDVCSSDLTWCPISTASASAPAASDPAPGAGERPTSRRRDFEAIGLADICVEWAGAALGAAPRFPSAGRKMLPSCGGLACLEVSEAMLFRKLVPVVAAGPALALSACDEAEQGRILQYEKGTYLGQGDIGLMDAQRDALRARVQRPSGC